jgi:hypothetical protein
MVLMRSPFLVLRVLAPTAAGLVAAGLLAAAPANAAGSMTPGVPVAVARVVTRPVPASLNATTTEDVLFGVSCPAARACTAVGSTNSDGTGARLAKAWNGSNWRIQAVPGDGFLFAVSCTSARACTAVGQTSPGKPLTERWNGTAWVNPRHNPGPLLSRLTGVSCTSATRCIAVGHNGNGALAERWNGTTWALRTVPTPAGFNHDGLTDVSCTSASACTAVGFYINDDDNHLPLAATWNGTTWTVRATPPVSDLSSLNSLSCTSASACMAVGTSPIGGNEIPTPLAEAWNGVAWKILPVPDPAGNGSLNGVSCSSAVACTAVGSASTGALAERWNGAKWAVQATPDAAGATLFSVSCSSATACTAVGEASPSVNASGNHVTLAERWNGTTWAIQPTPGNPAAAPR